MSAEMTDIKKLAYENKKIFCLKRSIAEVKHVKPEHRKKKHKRQG